MLHTHTHTHTHTSLSMQICLIRLTILTITAKVMYTKHVNVLSPFFYFVYSASLSHPFPEGSLSLSPFSPPLYSSLSPSLSLPLSLSLSLSLSLPPSPFFFWSFLSFKIVVIFFGFCCFFFLF